MAEPDQKKTDERKPMMAFAADGSLSDPMAPPVRKVVRTYASDLASLSGKAAGQAAAVPEAKPAQPPPAPAPKQEPASARKPEAEQLVDGVSLPTPEPVRAHEPPVPPPAPAWTPPQKPRETYSVDRDFASVAAYASGTREPIPRPAAATPVFERAVSNDGPGFFARLFGLLFGNAKPAEPLEGKILTSTVVRRSDAKSDRVVPAAASLPPAPLPAPLPPLPAPAASEDPSPPAADEERDATLARLRERLAARAGEAPPPAFPTPMPDARSQPRPAPPPPLLPGVPAAPRAPEPLQTYSGDFSKRIDAERASAFAVIAADQDRKRGEPQRAQRELPAQPGLLYVIFATVLVVGGATSLYLAYSYIRSGQSVLPVATPASSLIAANEQAAVRKEDGDPYRLFRDAAEAPQPNGSIRVVYYTIATTTPAGGTTDVRQPGTVFLSAMRLRAPEILTRSVRSESTVGGVGANGRSTPFFILSIASYERSFSGMLAWEATIADDLSLLYPAHRDEIPLMDPLATSTAPIATSSPVAAQPVSSAPRGFVDEVVESYDVRVLRDSAGRSILLYGYRDERTLIIVRDEASFAAVLTRLINSGRE